MNFFNKKVLVAYYSRRGQNYVSGNIVDLKKGNTEVIAEMIQSMTNGNLLEIDTIKPYPVDYTQTTEVAKNELRSKARPELKIQLSEAESYDVIFLGYPNWWGTMPMPVFTFLENNNFSNKVIIPFCTHEGSGMGHSEADVKKLCPKAIVLRGLAIHGTSSSSSSEQIKKWIESL